MQYPAIGDFNGGVCPQSHPVALISLFYEFFFDTSKFGKFAVMFVKLITGIILTFLNRKRLVSLRLCEW
jgi:hypothetical protein